MDGTDEMTMLSRNKTPEISDNIQKIQVLRKKQYLLALALKTVQIMLSM
jgi:hypothetical protein